MAVNILHGHWYMDAFWLLVSRLYGISNCYPDCILDHILGCMIQHHCIPSHLGLLIKPKLNWCSQYYSFLFTRAYFIATRSWELVPNPRTWCMPIEDHSSVDPYCLPAFLLESFGMFFKCSPCSETTTLVPRQTLFWPCLWWLCALTWQQTCHGVKRMVSLSSP